MVDISAVVVTFNSENEIEECVRSLFANYKSIEVFVVDNSSLDNTLRVLKTLQKEYKNLFLEESGGNIGLAAANNLPMSKFRGEYVLVVNPDTITLKSSIGLLLEKLRGEPKIGMIGPQAYWDNMDYHSSFHYKWNLSRILLFRIVPYRLMRYIYDKALFRRREGEVALLSGMYFLMKTSLYRKLNGYDPYYFLTLCDVGDLGIRVRKEGFICYYFPRAEVIHSGGRSNSQVKVLTQIKGIEGELYFLKKNFGNRQYRFAKCVFYLFYKFRYALLLTSYKLFRKKPIYERLKVTNAIINHLKQFKLPI